MSRGLVPEAVFRSGALGMAAEGCGFVNRLIHGWVYYLLASLGGVSASGVVAGWRK